MLVFADAQEFSLGETLVNAEHIAEVDTWKYAKHTLHISQVLPVHLRSPQVLQAHVSLHLVLQPLSHF